MPGKNLLGGCNGTFPDSSYSGVSIVYSVIGSCKNATTKTEVDSSIGQSLSLLNNNTGNGFDFLNGTFGSNATCCGDITGGSLNFIALPLGSQLVGNLSSTNTVNPNCNGSVAASLQFFNLAFRYDQSTNKANIGTMNPSFQFATDPHFCFDCFPLLNFSSLTFPTINGKFGISTASLTVNAPDGTSISISASVTLS